MSTLTFRLLTRIVAFIFAAVIITTLLSSWGSLTTGAPHATTVSRHTISISNNQFSYRAVAGYLPVNSNNASANIFYTAYHLNNSANRPITFVFNGGPGSAAIWLHMGALAPVRVQNGTDEHSANPHTWLGFTDLVFIDPVGTGYSRVADGVAENRFYGFKEDVEVIAQFIAEYLNSNSRRASAVYLTGESYGGARAVGLAAQLQSAHGIKVAGLTLISPALNYQTVTFKPGNDAAYPLYLPTYAQIAQFHNRLSPRLQALHPQVLAVRVKEFANSSYRQILAGDTTNLSKKLDTLSYYTGINKNVLKQRGGRISDTEFARLILNEDGSRTGIFDARVAGITQKGDPSEAALRTTYPKALKQYFETALGYKTSIDYRATINISNWNFGANQAGHNLNVIPVLKQLIKNDPDLKVHVVGGYYDLATPVETIRALVADAGAGRIKSNYYYAGHMIYTDDDVNAQFYTDSKTFYTYAKK